MRTLLLLSLLAAGCDKMPHWIDERTDLDRVPLSVWTRGGAVFVSGGPLGSPGQGLFLRKDGSGWREIATGSASTLWWVFGLADNDVWTVGENGTILHWDGSALTPETPPTSETLFGIWGASADELWAVGGTPDVDGVLLRRSAGVWTAVTGLPNTGAYFKVWGAAAGDVYVCGQGGTILHWDGSAWSAEDTAQPRYVSLFTVAGRSSDDVYTVGGLGNAVALRHSAAGWAPLDDKLLAEAPALAGVAVAADGTLAMVGQSGTKLRGKPGALVDDTEQATRADFHSVTFDGAGLWAVGGNWIAPAPAARHGVIVRFGN
jgi:hypothetical protein